MFVDGLVVMIVDADTEQRRKIVDVCLLGPFLTIKHSAPRMTAGGSIIIRPVSTRCNRAER